LLAGAETPYKPATKMQNAGEMVEELAVKVKFRIKIEEIGPDARKTAERRAGGSSPPGGGLHWGEKETENVGGGLKHRRPKGQKKVRNFGVLAGGLAKQGINS